MFVFGNPKEILKFYMFPKKNSEKTNKFLTKAQCDRRTKKFLTRVTDLLRTIVYCLKKWLKNNYKYPENIFFDSGNIFLDGTTFM